MRRFFVSTLIFCLDLAALLVSPRLVFAQAASGDRSGGLVSCSGPDCNFDKLLALIGKVFDFFVLIAVPVATVAIVYAGVIMVVHRDSAGKLGDAKKVLWTAIGGLVLVLASYVIVKTLLDYLLDTGVMPNPLS